MAICVTHERCPSCAKRGRDKHGDNLGVYDDGSAFCYSCGYRRVGSNLALDGELSVKTTDQGSRAKPEGVARQSNCLDDKKPVNLPKDAVSLVYGSSEAAAWIDQYGLTASEIQSNLILYSEGGVYSPTKQELIAPMVIFPIYNNEGDLRFYSSRNLKYEVNGGTKWYLRGNPTQTIYGICPDSKKIQHICCICEDIISAIKIGRIFPAYPLFGKSLNLNLLTYLSENYSDLLIYLDYDAFDKMIRMKSSFAPYFHTIRVVLSDHDPKCYSTEELWEILK